MKIMKKPKTNTMKRLLLLALCLAFYSGYSQKITDTIHSQKLDEERSLLWFAPRKGGTGWSKPNKERVERMLAEGKMAPAGLAKVEAAKADGTWTLLDEVETLTVPPDLAAALAALPPAAEAAARGAPGTVLSPGAAPPGSGN